MASRSLTGTYNAGYRPAATYTGLYIGQGAFIGGTGLIAMAPVDIATDGTIEGYGPSFALDLRGGGSVTNLAQGLIDSSTIALRIEATYGTAVNLGTIDGGGPAGIGVALTDGGSVVNAGAAALIEGGQYGVDIATSYGSVLNDGTIRATDGAITNTAVYLRWGGSVTNDASGVISGDGAGIWFTQKQAGTIDNAGLVEGAFGVYLGDGGSVVNDGTIEGGGLPAIVGYGAATALVLVNGGLADTIALIEASSGVLDTGMSSAVTNYGTILGEASTGWGVRLSGAGAIGNIGSAALIEGGLDGIDVLGLGTGSVVNDGTIQGGDCGVYLAHGGYVVNAGTIESAADIAVYVKTGGTVTNGAGGVISGGLAGLYVALGAGSVVNDGSIEGGAGTGIWLKHGGRILNDGLIAGGSGGVHLSSGTGTVVNYGTIAGSAGDSVLFGTTGDLLVVEAGSAFVGDAVGDGGTLELAAAERAGTFGGLGSAFTGFTTLLIDSGASWTFTGANDLGGATMTTHGTLDLDGTISGGGMLVMPGLLTVGSGASTIAPSVNDTGTIAIGGGATLGFTGSSDSFSGSIGGAGTLVFAGGAAALNDGAALAVAGWSVLGGTVSLGENLAYAGALTLSRAALALGTHALTLTGSATLGGAIGGTGRLIIGGGIATVSAGANITVASWTLSGAGTTLTLAQSLSYAGAFSATTGTAISLGGGDKLILAGTGAISGVVASGPGTLDLQGPSNVSGLTAGGAAELENAGTLTAHGAGLTVGDIAGDTAWVYNIAGAVFDIIDNSGIAGGPSANGYLLNRGLLEKTGGSGTSTIAIGVTDLGSVSIASGTLAFSGPTNSFSGAIGGAGALAFGGGNSTLNAGTTVTVARWSLAGGSVAFQESLAFGGALTQSAGTLALGANTLTLSGTDSLAGTIGGTGTLSMAGGGDTLNAGIALTVKHWTSAAAVSLNTGLVYAGALTQTAGTLALKSNTLTLTGSDSFAGTVTGTGTLAFTGGSDMIAAGAAIGTAAWTVSGGATSVAFAETLTYSGAFGVTRGTIAIAGGDTLSLTRSAALSGAIVTGAGTLALSGTTTITGLALGGTIALDNTGTASAGGGTLTIGDTAGNRATLDNHGTFNLTDNSLVAGGTATGSAIVNSGLFEKTGGTGTSTVAVDFTSAGTVIVDAGTLAFTGPSSTFSGALRGTGTLAFSAGGVALNAGTTVAAAAWTIKGGATTVTLAESLAYSGSFSDSAAIALGAGDKLILGGPAAFTGATVGGAGVLYVSGATSVTGLSIGGTVEFENTGTVTVRGGVTLGDAGGGATLLYNTAAATFDFLDNSGIAPGGPGTAAVTNYGLIEKTGGTGASTIAVGLVDLGAVTITSGTLAFSGADSFAGAIGGPGTLAFSGGSDALNGGATIGTTSWKISGGAVVTLGESLFFTGTLSEAQGTALRVGGGDTLTLSDACTLAGAVSGSGALAVTSGNVGISAGATVTVASWGQTAGIITLSESLVYSGMFNQAGGRIGIGAGDTLTLAGVNRFAGAATGAGSLNMTGGSDTIAASATISVAAWTFSGAATALALAESLAYAGAFTSGSGTITLGAGDKLILSGNAAFSATTVAGSGTLYLGGTTAVAGLFVYGTVELENTGTVTQAGNNLILGDSSGNAALFYNTAAGIWNIADDTGIGRGVSTSSTIDNVGLLEKTGGTGTSRVTPNLTNGGTIEVTSGTLELRGAISGAGGVLVGAGATLQFDGAVAAGQTVAFTGTTGELVLNDPSGSGVSFAGAISGFGGGDEIDLASFAYSGSAAAIWNQATASRGTLAITDGAKSAVLTLNGVYAAASFAVSEDGNGFLLVTDPPVSGDSVAHHAAAATLFSQPSAPPGSIDPGHPPAPDNGDLPTMPSHDETIAAFGAGTDAHSAGSWESSAFAAAPIDPAVERHHPFAALHGDGHETFA